jgi:hypothetical protein
LAPPSFGRQSDTPSRIASAWIVERQGAPMRLAGEHHHFHLAKLLIVVIAILFGSQIGH